MLNDKNNNSNNKRGCSCGSCNRHSPIISTTNLTHNLVSQEKIKMLNYENESMKMELLSIKGNSNPCVKHIQDIKMLKQQVNEKDNEIKKDENEIKTLKELLEEREVYILFIYSFILCV